MSGAQAGTAGTRAAEGDLSGWREIVARLPLTLRPALNQQLAEWPERFPFERQRLKGFFRGVEGFSSAKLSALLEPLQRIEEKMGVANWRFSAEHDTMENASQLARSVYYAEWRSEVQKVFDAIDARARQSETPARPEPRLILLALPETLPLDAANAGEVWKLGDGRAFVGGFAEFYALLAGAQPDRPSLRELFGGRAEMDPADLWILDAESEWSRSLAPPGGASLLSYAALKTFRERFLAALNTIPKDIHTATQTMVELQQTDWTPWCPAELAQDARLRKFVVDVFLSGNGSLIFSSAFVEWAASEALRRARPRVLAARFGMRNKPKPFTSIAVFENQQKISPLPDVADPEDSAVDAALLARYVALAAARYREYDRAIFIYISEHLKTVWIAAPDSTGFELSNEPLDPGKLYDAIRSWVQSIRP